RSLSHNNYREILKNSPKLASHVYKLECQSCGSKWTAAASASSVVLGSFTFYGLRSLTGWIADVIVDAVQMSRGKLSNRNFESNTVLKAYKYSLTGASADASRKRSASRLLLISSPGRFHRPPMADFIANSAAETLVGYVGTIDPADGRTNKKTD
ncbi:MAG: hypothetical protein SGPRY_009414, partial [Prymnesium sp.]